MRGGGGADHMSKVLPVHQMKVGLVIGRGGETIKMLQAKTGCHIQVGRIRVLCGRIVLTDVQVSRESDPNSQMKDVCLDGTNSQVAYAEEEINKILEENEARDAQRANPPFVMAIPTEAVGLLIGKAGMTIKQMQYRTGCVVQVSNSRSSSTL